MEKKEIIKVDSVEVELLDRRERVALCYKLINVLSRCVGARALRQAIDMYLNLRGYAVYKY